MTAWLAFMLSAGVAPALQSALSGDMVLGARKLQLKYFSTRGGTTGLERGSKSVDPPPSMRRIDFEPLADSAEIDYDSGEKCLELLGFAVD
jgi:hypothetical protein